MVKRRPSRRLPGFTLVELLVVMAIVATLLSLVTPRLPHGSVDRAREATLRVDLRTMRDAIDKFYSDRGRHPEALDDLVTHRYLREMQVDPISERRDTWLTVEHPDKLPGIYDVRSGSEGVAGDGTEYRSW